MAKSPDAFRTISEVADLLDVPAHVLRFWESRFPQIRPVKRAGGRRYYRPADVALLAGIRLLLHDQGLTIRGVQKILREQGMRHVCALAGHGLAPEAQEEWAEDDGLVLPAAAVEEDRVIPWPGPRSPAPWPESPAAEAAWSTGLQHDPGDTGAGGAAPPEPPGLPLEDAAFARSGAAPPGVDLSDVPVPGEEPPPAAGDEAPGDAAALGVPPDPALSAGLGADLPPPAGAEGDRLPGDQGPDQASPDNSAAADDQPESGPPETADTAEQALGIEVEAEAEVAPAAGTAALAEPPAAADDGEGTAPPPRATAAEPEAEAGELLPVAEEAETESSEQEPVAAPAILPAAIVPEAETEELPPMEEAATLENGEEELSGMAPASPPLATEPEAEAGESPPMAEAAVAESVEEEALATEAAVGPPAGTLPAAGESPAAAGPAALEGLPLFMQPPPPVPPVIRLAPEEDIAEDLRRDLAALTGRLRGLAPDAQARAALRGIARQLRQLRDRIDRAHPPRE